MLENKKLLEFSFVKANQFCLDQKLLFEKDFKIVPELIYTEPDYKKTNGKKVVLNSDGEVIQTDTSFLENEENHLKYQLPQGISQEFKEKFLNENSIDPYYQVGDYYIQLSKPLQICLQLIKKNK